MSTETSWRRPPWRRTITGIGPIMQDDSLSQQEQMTRVAKLLREDEAFPEDMEFQGIVEELDAYAQDDDIMHFDQALDELYDWADDDEHRVWIDPIR